MKKIINNVLPWVPAALWMGMIFFASSLSDPLPIVKDETSTALSWPIHAMEYAGLSFWLVFGQTRGKLISSQITSRILLTAFLATVVFGLTDELHQYFVPGRTFRMLDIFVDMIGAGFFLLGLGALQLNPGDG